MKNKLSKTELDELETFAKNASPGPWTLKTLHSTNHRILNTDKHTIVSTTSNQSAIHYKQKELDVEYIIRANPETMLKLIQMIKDAPKISMIKCPACHGSGDGKTISVPEQSWMDTRTFPCDACDGSGKLKKVK